MPDVKPTTFHLSDEAKEALNKLAKADRRSMSQMLEVLIIREAEKLGIMPTPKENGGTGI
jgi:predicted transcriptional regulator